MTYRQHMLSLEPQVYMDFTEDYTVNLGTLGGTTSQQSTQTIGKRTAYYYALMPTDNKQMTHFTGTHNRSKTVNKSYNKDEWTLAYWCEVATNITIAMLTVDDIYTRRLVLQWSGSAVRYSLGSNDYITSAAVPLDIRNMYGGAVHIVARKEINTSTTGTLRIYVNGYLAYTYGPNVNAATQGIAYTPPRDYVQWNTTSSALGSEGAFWDRALTVEEIRSMSVDYIPIVEGSWTILENGLEVPLTVEGATEMGQIVPVVFSGPNL